MFLFTHTIAISVEQGHTLINVLNITKQLYASFCNALKNISISLRKGHMNEPILCAQDNAIFISLYLKIYNNMIQHCRGALWRNDRARDLDTRGRGSMSYYH